MNNAEGKKSPDDLAMNELRKLVDDGVNSSSALLDCTNLAKRAWLFNKQMPFIEWQNPSMLIALLRLVVEDEREKLKGAKSYVSVAGEFIGFRDQAKPDDPRIQDYEYSEKEASEVTARKIRLLRGGRILPPRSSRSAKPIKSVRNTGDYVDTALKALLRAVDQFLIRDDAVTRIRASLKTQPSQGANSSSPDSITVDMLEFPGTPGYIHRQMLEAEFKRSVDGGAKLIALVGFPGMGKTSMAEALASDYPFFELRDGQLPLTDLRFALAEHDLEIGNLTPENAWERLVELLALKQGPEFIVLDNVDDLGILRARFPRNSTTRVIVTCREWSDQAPPWCHRLTVDVMRLDEAAKLVRTTLPSLSAEDAKSVATSLGCYPLFIGTACGVARTTGVDIQSVCNLLEINPGDVKVDAHENLRIILDRAIVGFRRREASINPITERLLALIASTARLRNSQALTRAPWPTIESLLTYVEECATPGWGPDYQQMNGLKAIKVLMDSSLVSIVATKSAEHVTSKDTFLRIHPFVQETLRTLMEFTIGQVLFWLRHDCSNLHQSIVLKSEKFEFDDKLKDYFRRLRALQLLEWGAGSQRDDFFLAAMKTQVQVERFRLQHGGQLAPQQLASIGSVLDFIADEVSTISQWFPAIRPVE